MPKRNVTNLQNVAQYTGLYFMAVVNRDTAKDKITKAWFQYGRNQPRTQAL